MKPWAIILYLMITMEFKSYAEDPIKTLSQKLKEAIPVEKPPLIAVLDFTYPRGRMSTGSYLVSERLVTYLVQKRASVIERRLIEKILEERKIQETGLVDPTSLKQVGEIMGVDAVAIGTMSDLTDEQTQVMARLIRVNTGEIITGATIVMPRVWRDLPRVPKVAQMRTPVPFSDFNLEKNSGKDVNSKQKLADVDPTIKRSRYHPAPVPVFMPSSGRRSLGGSVK